MDSAGIEEDWGNDLYLKPEKAEFWVQRLVYFGMIIELRKIFMDSVKLDGIRQWLVPATIKQVWQFLGFGHFYRKFISGYSFITCPLNNLLKKEHKFVWTNKCNEAFQTLKQKFTEELVLQMPDINRPFLIEADASKYASEAVLCQED